MCYAYASHFRTMVLTFVTSEVSLRQTRLRAYKFYGNAVRVNASSHKADDRNLLSGEFYCASSYSEHVTLREIARLPKFRSRLGIVNFPIVLRQIFVISARTTHRLVMSQKALCAYELFTLVLSIDGG